MQRTYGNLNHRQLNLLAWAPPSMERFNPATLRFAFAWASLLSPCAWARAIFRRDNWRFSWARHKGVNHRCYCNAGSLCDVSLVVAGFGVNLWYSHYTGDVPCWCDRAIDRLEIEADND